jgi:hypothetical protein
MVSVKRLKIIVGQPASCEVSKTKYLLFRLVRNLSEEGFPTCLPAGRRALLAGMTANINPMQSIEEFF